MIPVRHVFGLEWWPGDSRVETVVKHPTILGNSCIPSDKNHNKPLNSLLVTRQITLFHQGVRMGEKLVPLVEYLQTYDEDLCVCLRDVDLGIFRGFEFDTFYQKLLVASCPRAWCCSSPVVTKALGFSLTTYRGRWLSYSGVKADSFG